MRRFISTLGIVTAAIVVPVSAQNSGGGSAGGSAGAGAAGVSAGANANGSASVGVQQQIQGNQAGAGATTGVGASTVPGGTQPPPTAQQPQQFGATNSGAGLVGTNVGADQSSVQQPVPPTSRPGGTNYVYATNSAGTTNLPEWLQRDQAITAQDQTMLQQMRQAVFQGQSTAGWMQSVHFILKDGAVRIVGVVPTLAERQRIESIVAQTPGVVRVYDALAVNPSAGAAGGTVDGSAKANATANPPLPPTSIVPTNIGDGVPPNSRFTNIIYETGQQPK